MGREGAPDTGDGADRVCRMILTMSRRKYAAINQLGFDSLHPIRPGFAVSRSDHIKFKGAVAKREVFAAALAFENK